MGIKNFSKAFKACRTVKIKDLAGKTIAIDAMTELYRAALGAKSISSLTDANGKPTMHISVIIANILEFYKCNVGQIWVFDHDQDPNKDFHNPMKLEELAKRKKRKELALDKIKSIADVKEDKPLFSDDEGDDDVQQPTSQSTSQPTSQPTPQSKSDKLAVIDSELKTNIEPQLETSLERPVVTFDQHDEDLMKDMNRAQRSTYKLNKIKKVNEEFDAKLREIQDKKDSVDKLDSLEKQTFSLPKEMINDVKLILNCLNIQYIEAPEGFEGEAVASYLTTLGLADGVFSGDTDPIAYGATVLYRRNPRDKLIYEYTIADILSQIADVNEDHESPTIADFRRAALALGTDACEKTPGIGAQTVLKKLYSIKLTKKQLEAMKEFEKVPTRESIVINNLDKTPFTDCNQVELINWLVNERSFGRTRMQGLFDKALAAKEKSNSKSSAKPCASRTKSSTKSKPKVQSKPRSKARSDDDDVDSPPPPSTAPIRRGTVVKKV